MDVQKKSFELQAQVRHNAEEFKNTLNDLYNWQKDIKDKEEELIKQQVPTDDEMKLKTLPVRSHVLGQSNNKEQQQAELVTKEKKSNEQNTAVTPPTTPVEKTEVPLDTNEEKRQRANEFKDRGNQYVKLSEYDKAIYAYTEAIEVFPEDAVFYSNRALCHLKLEQYNDCIEDCERAIEIDKLSVKAHYRRMQANESLGNNMDALKDCTTVLMIEPKNREAQKSLDRINERLRKHANPENGPNFSELRDNMVDILPIDKPAYKRSTQPLRRVPITEVVLPKLAKDNVNLKISDEDIDRLFNSNCGPFVEVKGGKAAVEAPQEKKAPETATATTSNRKGAPETTTKAKIEQPIATTTNTTNKKPMKSPAAATTTTSSNKDTKETPSTSKKKKSAGSAAFAAPYQEDWLSPAMQPLAVDPTLDSNKIQEEVQQVTNIEDSKETEQSATAPSSPPPPSPPRPAPVTTHQFYANWKELTMPQKYQYLKSIETAHLCRILGAGFDSDTLTDIIRLLHDHYVPNEEPALAATLLAISKNNQVGILSLLMSREERKTLAEVINTIKECDLANTISKNFNINFM